MGLPPGGLRFGAIRRGIFSGLKGEKKMGAEGFEPPTYSV